MTSPEPEKRPSPTPPVLEPIVCGECDKGRPRCRKPARLYAVGWCCAAHAPKPSTTPSTRPAEAA